MNSLLKEVFGIIVLILLLFGSVGIYTIVLETNTPSSENLDFALREKATKEYLDQKIVYAINSDKFDDVLMYHHLSEYLGISLSPKTLKEIEEHSGILSKRWRDMKSFGKGFCLGESEDMMGLAGAITADMTVVGDLRDLSIEGSKFVKNEPYDKLIFGMSAIGVGLSVSQVYSIGATTPLKVSASIVKVAKKMNYLSKPFINIVSSKLSKAIDLQALKKVDYSSLDSIKNAVKRISKSLDNKFIRKTFRNVNTIKANTSILDTVTLLKYVDNPKDMQRVANISKKYKTNTKAVFKVLGKGAIKGVKKLINWTQILVAQLISFILSLFSLVMITKRIIKGFIYKIIGV